MIEVFKTTVSNVEQANEIKLRLLEIFPGMHIHFDLEDCDKILRIEGSSFTTNEVIHLLKGTGFSCEVLKD
ncbi:MAG TPA: hypothetical protein VK750_06725 [Cytophagaceae bacterium]|jgi:hypothetical protein|nr:hypothetical protein [Cytophagaceae bacterium]